MQVVDALRPVTDKPLDCHLMIVEPELRVADFAKVRRRSSGLRRSSSWSADVAQQAASWS